MIAIRQAVRRARWPNGDDGRRWLVLVRKASLVLRSTVSVPNSALLPAPLDVGQRDEGETLLLTVRVPVDAAEAGRVARSITERWLDHLAVGADGTTD